MTPNDASVPPSWFGAQIRAAMDRDALRLAVVDIRSGWRQRVLWGTLGVHDIRQRYRRSTLGPFWITASMGIMILALGIVYGQIFKIDLTDYLPFLASGFIVWGLIASIVNEGTSAFISGRYLIHQVAAPLSIHVFRVLWTNTIVFAHNLIIIVFVAVWFRINPGLGVLLVVPGLALLLLNGLWMALLLGLLSARFRDIPLIVASVVQVLFFITPVMWKPSMLPGRAWFLDLNPFYHLIEIVRGPLLGSSPSLENWIAAVAIAAVGWTVALLFFAAYRWRIAYWL